MTKPHAGMRWDLTLAYLYQRLNRAKLKVARVINADNEPFRCNAQLAFLAVGDRQILAKPALVILLVLEHSLTHRQLNNQRSSQLAQWSSCRRLSNPHRSLGEAHLQHLLVPLNRLELELFLHQPHATNLRRHLDPFHQGHLRRVLLQVQPRGQRVRPHPFPAVHQQVARHRVRAQLPHDALVQDLESRRQGRRRANY